MTKRHQKLVPWQQRDQGGSKMESQKTSSFEQRPQSQLEPLSSTYTQPIETASADNFSRNFHRSQTKAMTNPRRSLDTEPGEEYGAGQ
jgi:hypothetical protein